MHSRINTVQNKTKNLRRQHMCHSYISAHIYRLIAQYKDFYQLNLKILLIHLPLSKKIDFFLAKLTF